MVSFRSAFASLEDLVSNLLEFECFRILAAYINKPAIFIELGLNVERLLMQVQKHVDLKLFLGEEVQLNLNIVHQELEVILFAIFFEVLQCNSTSLFYERATLLLCISVIVYLCHHQICVDKQRYFLVLRYQLY